MAFTRKEIQLRYRLRHPGYWKKDAARAAKWARDNPEWFKNYRNTHRIKFREWRRNSKIKRKYGISAAEYGSLLKAQNNICAVCKKPFAGNLRCGTDPVLDHRHGGKIREFIHRKCNVAIGFLCDDPVLCRLAAEYLEKHASF
jgi:hypothetical protein